MILSGRTVPNTGESDIAHAKTVTVEVGKGFFVASYQKPLVAEYLTAFIGLSVILFSVQPASAVRTEDKAIRTWFDTHSTVSPPQIATQHATAKATTRLGTRTTRLEKVILVPKRGPKTAALAGRK